MLHSMACAARWATAAPEAALRLALEQLPHAAAPVMETWLSIQPEEASTFLRDEMSPGLVRDQSIAVLIQSIRRTDPDSARAWLEEIRDPEIQQYTREDLANPSRDPFAP